jgi:hypothetical protein
MQRVMAHVARVLAGPLDAYGLPSKVSANQYIPIASHLLDPSLPLPALSSSNSSSRFATSTADPAHPSSAAVIETAYVVAVLHAAVVHTQSNTPHVKQQMSSFALAELLASLPLLRQAPARAKLLAKLLGVDAGTAGNICERVGQSPLESVLFCSDAMVDEDQVMHRLHSASREVHRTFKRYRRTSVATNPATPFASTAKNVMGPTTPNPKPTRVPKRVVMRGAVRTSTMEEDAVDIEKLPAAASAMLRRASATRDTSEVNSVQLAMEDTGSIERRNSVEVESMDSVDWTKLDDFRLATRACFDSGTLNQEEAFEAMLVSNSQFGVTGAASSVFCAFPAVSDSRGAAHVAVMTPHQRALYTFARWTSGGHFDGVDQLHALALDLFINSLQFVVPTIVHRTVVVHVLTTLCTSAPTSIVRVYYARALRTLFGRGSASPAPTIKRGADKKPVPNLAKSVIIAIHDILHAHLVDVAMAQNRSRHQELPPMSPATAMLSMLPGVAMPQLSTPAFPRPDADAASPNWSALAPRASAFRSAASPPGISLARASSPKDDVARDLSSGFADASAVTREEAALAANPIVRLKAASDRLAATALEAAKHMTMAGPGLHDQDPVRLTADQMPRRSDSVPPTRPRAESPPPGAQMVVQPLPVRDVEQSLQFSRSLPPSHVLAPENRRRLETTKADLGFDLQVLMGFVGDLLHESKAASSRPHVPKTVTPSARRSQQGDAENLGDSGSGPDPGSCHNSLSCGSCDGPCAIRISTLTVTIGVESDAAQQTSVISAPGKLDSVRGEVAYQPADDTGALGDVEGRRVPIPALHNIIAETESPLEHRSPVIAQPYFRRADTSKHGADGSVHELHGLRSSPYPTATSLGDAAPLHAPLEPPVKITGPVVITALQPVAVDELSSSKVLPNTAISNTGTSDAAAARERPGLEVLCPSADRGGAALGLWMEASRAIAHAAVKLSSIPESGDGITPEYRAVLACALQLCSACPLLREIVLRRILRKWPTGNSDNEIALLEFMATVLATTTHRADLVVTDLRSLMLVRILRCLRSTHVKVARNSLILVDPHRKLCDFLVDDPISMRKLLDMLHANGCSHWSPMVQKASVSCYFSYKQQYDNRWGKITSQTELEALLAVAAQQHTKGLLRWVHVHAGSEPNGLKVGPYQPPIGSPTVLVPPSSRRRDSTSTPSRSHRSRHRHNSAGSDDSEASSDMSSGYSDDSGSRKHRHKSGHHHHKRRQPVDAGADSDSSADVDYTHAASPHPGASLSRCYSRNGATPESSHPSREQRVIEEVQQALRISTPVDPAQSASTPDAHAKTRVSARTSLVGAVPITPAGLADDASGSNGLRKCPPNTPTGTNSDSDAGSGGRISDAESPLAPTTRHVISPF